MGAPEQTQTVIDRTPAVPPAPAASFDDVKHDLERASGSSKGVMHGGEHEVDSTKGQANLARRLNARQITFIGFSGGIGTGECWSCGCGASPVRCRRPRGCLKVWWGSPLTLSRARQVSLSVPVRRMPSRVPLVSSCAPASHCGGLRLRLRG